MKAEHRRSLVALTFFLGVLGFGLADGVIPVDASQQLPERSTSPHPDCSSEPGRPDSYPGLAGLSDRASFPVVGSIDANGCDSWVYELLGSFGPDGSFFAGPGFHTGLHAYQYGTQETTEILDGRQLIRVADPTKEWKRVYKGFDACTTRVEASGTTVNCIAPAVKRRPDDWTPWIAIGILLGAFLVFMIHYLRPAGPIRRKRHFHRAHGGLRQAIPPTNKQLEGIDLRQLQRRLRRLERYMDPELSESQHHWFRGLLASGKHGMALESLTRWLAESRVPYPTTFVTRCSGLPRRSRSSVRSGPYSMPKSWLPRRTWVRRRRLAKGATSPLKSSGGWWPTPLTRYPRPSAEQ